jgi:hypothetical protein
MDRHYIIYYWVPGALPLGIKRPELEAAHSPPTNAEVKNAWSYTFTPQYVFMARCLVHRDNFTFAFIKIFIAIIKIGKITEQRKEVLFSHCLNKMKKFPKPVNE